MNHYAIELKRGPKNVQCIVRLGGEVEFKTYPLTKMIRDHEYATDSGEYQFDRRWQPCSEEQDPVCTVSRVIDSFLSGTLPATPKARRWLEALRDNPAACEPLHDSTQPTEEGEATMSTKKAKTKKAPKAKKEKAEGYKGLRPGTAIEKLAKYHDEKTPERTDFMTYAEKAGISKGSAAGAWQFIKNGLKKVKA